MLPSARLPRPIDRKPMAQVLAGDVMPVDGIVVRGTAAVSTAHLTGESATTRVAPGMSVSGGSHVHEGSIQVWCLAPAADSAVSHTLALVERAQGRGATV